MASSARFGLMSHNPTNSTCVGVALQQRAAPHADGAHAGADDGVAALRPRPLAPARTRASRPGWPRPRPCRWSSGSRVGLETWRHSTQSPVPQLALARASRTSRSRALRVMVGGANEFGARLLHPAEAFEQVAARARQVGIRRQRRIRCQGVDERQAGRRTVGPAHRDGVVQAHDRRPRDVGEPGVERRRCAPSRSPPASPPARDRRRCRPAARRSRRPRRARWRARAPPGRVRSAADPSGRDPDRAAGSPRRAGRRGRGSATPAAPSARPARAPRLRRARASPARGRGAAPPRTATGGSSPRRRSPRSPR